MGWPVEPVRSCFLYTPIRTRCLRLGPHWRILPHGADSLKAHRMLDGNILYRLAKEGLIVGASTSTTLGTIRKLRSPGSGAGRSSQGRKSIE
jgi:hypothetical protein